MHICTLYNRVLDTLTQSICILFCKGQTNNDQDQVCTPLYEGQLTYRPLPHGAYQHHILRGKYPEEGMEDIVDGPRSKT